jgi:hypothetical protein
MAHSIQSSLSVTGSITVSGAITGSVSGSVTGVLFGNATTATTAVTATSASFSTTASYWSGSIQNANSASYALTASHVLGQSVTSSYALTASYWSGSIQNVNSASFATTASYYAETDPVFTARSASLATTGSNTFTGNQTITGNLNVVGTASIAYLNVVIESSSVIYSSGSNQFGDAANDTQWLYGSTYVSGAFAVTGAAFIPNLTASAFGTSSAARWAATASFWSGSIIHAQSASFATTASYWSGSIQNVLSSSYSVTASYWSGSIVNAQSSSFATTASYWSGSIVNAQSASFATTASYWSGSIQNALSSSYSVSSSFATSASYALNGGVTQLLAGPNITLSPTSGKGQVTVSATLSGSTIFNTATGSYGSFYDTTTQTNPVANIPRSMSFDSTDITNGVSISGSTSPFNTYIKTQNAGVYDIQFSAQVEKTDSGTDEITIWLRKNGIDLTDSATKLTLSGNGTKVVAAWNWFVSSAANDYYQIIWVSADTGMRLYAEPINSTPGIPSVILTVNRVDQFLSNTGSFTGEFTGAFTGSLLGTATSASYAPTNITGNIDNRLITATGTDTLQGEPNLKYSGTTFQITGSTEIAGILYVNGVQVTGTYDTSSFITAAQTASMTVATASFATSASWAPSTPTFPYTGSAVITGSLTVTGSVNINGALLQTTTFTVNNTTATLYSFAATTPYTALFVDYVARNGSNLRAGQIMLASEGTDTVLSETTTTDIGDTTQLTFNDTFNTGIAALTCTTTTSGWSIKTTAKYI